MARLKEPINLRQLADEGVVFQIDADDVQEPEDYGDEDVPASENTEHSVFDEDTYEGESFEVMGRKMFDMIPNGKIKKRIIREGEGEKPQELATVKIHYNGYLEYEEEPFDSTYTRNRPRKFVIGKGEILAGLDFGVQTMKLKEKSQFLVHPDYAFGKNCMIGRIPPNAQILFEVEVIDIINSGAALTFEKLSEEDQRNFPEIYKYALALREKATTLFKEHDVKKAIKNYNMAASKLEKAVLSGKEEVEKHHDLCLKLYTNLLICYTRDKEPHKACYNAKKIYDLTNNGELMKIPAKVYFNHAKSLRILSEYDSAKAILDKAYKMEPKNPEIANELLNLQKDMEEHKKQRMAFAKALVGNRDK